ncbi:MAG TPA: deoxyribodipyrimidine photo-lyase [Daejeonella sp.]|nr:deoxyribodipyrimidine photo-lyase [Daejeonella sp.]
MKSKVSICWIRRDLRINDNTAFYHALTSKHPVLVLFIFDTLILDKLSDRKDKRVTFIYRALQTLNDTLIQNGSSLCILHDSPLSAFEKICDQYDVRGIFVNQDYEPYALNRDAQIKLFAEEKDIPFQSFKDQVIFEKSEVMKADGSPYTVYTPYSKIWKQKYLHEPPTTFAVEDYLKNLFKTKLLHFPSLEEIGFEEEKLIVAGLPVNEETILKYHETRNIPSLNGTSQLGVHLRFGTVSVRQVVQLASRLNEQWLNELIWREFFMMILFHFPYVVNQSFKKKYDQIKWRNNEAEFKLWCDGQTGYPIVDAGMRQLNETGWMHNRVRMIVASFLTKHLLIDWRWGEAYFAEKLLDYELSSNNGNWQWAAGSGCDAAPYFRVFNPTEQTRKFDPQLRYIKTWVKDFSLNYLQPIVDHDFARKRALQVYKSSLTED